MSLLLVSRRTVASILPLLLLLIASCAQVTGLDQIRERAQLVVQVTADDDVIAQATSLTLTIERQPRGMAFPDTLIADRTEFQLPSVSGESFPVSMEDFSDGAIGIRASDNRNALRISVAALAGGDRDIVAVQRALSFVPEDDTRVLRIHLFGGSCIGEVCDVSSSCFRGDCATIPEFDPNSLPRVGEDAGVDAAVDADVDARDAAEDTLEDTSLDGPEDAATDGPDVLCPSHGSECSAAMLEALGGCERGEIRCEEDGTEYCEVVGVRAAGFECRPPIDECDAAELCDGTSGVCPEDVFAPDVTTSCGGDRICVGGSCVACAHGESCLPDLSNPCQLGQVDCTSGIPRCVPSGPAEEGRLCRASAGLCDIAETCDGTSTECPADTFDSGTLCRMARGACDTAEFCPGDAAACPEDRVMDVGTVCRSAGGECGVAEFCDGTSKNCPADEHLPAAAVCRVSNGSCDREEECTGSSASCPTDGFAGAGEICRAGDDCNVAEVCSGTSPACPSDEFASAGEACTLAAGGAGLCDGSGSCDSASCGEPCSPGPCAEGTFDCSSGSPVCVVTSYRTGTTCRPAVDDCDIGEVCQDGSAECPVDAFRAVGFVCRGQDGDCDVAEVCSGDSPVCPVDAFEPATVVCRAATAGGCDVAERCPGDSADCPTNEFVAAGVSCRDAAGDCDLAEVCSGASADCPPNSFRPAGFGCRDAAGPCDAPEQCTGSSAACPADELRSAGFVCDASISGTCDLSDICNGASASCPERVRPASHVCRPSTGMCDPAENCDGTTLCPSESTALEGTSCSTSECMVGETCMDNACGGGRAEASGFECGEEEAGTSGRCFSNPDPDTSLCTRVVISEVAPYNGRDNGFVELYNAGPLPFDLRTCVIEIGPINIPLNRAPSPAIDSHGFFLVEVGTSCSYDPDVCFEATMPRRTDPGLVELTCEASGDYVDSLAWSMIGPEGTVTPIDDGASWERISRAGATSAQMCQVCPGDLALSGNGFDSNRNLVDFVVQAEAFPQNTDWGSEP